ncbi:MAG TPA: glycosyltransferase, partial [Pseudomonadota bacterium]|nr:glycosyltransferase [Pseudomonadota bacterium]
MRVLYLTTEFLWPAHQGGRVRSLAQLRLLAAQPEVSQLTVLSFAEVAVSPAELAALRAAVRQSAPPAPPASAGVSPRAGLKVEVLPPIHHPIHLKQAPAELLRVAALRARTGVPYLATKWRSAELERVLLRELEDGGYDLVYLDHLGMALYLQLVRRACPAARLVLDEHNVESDFFAQFAARAPLALRPLARFEHAAAARFEAETLAAVDAVVAISQLDAEALTALTLRHTGKLVRPQVVPQVVQSTEPRRPPPAEPRLGYVGNLTWHPNALGLSWFCSAVWPRLQRELPAARLSIAGSGLALDGQGRPLAPKAWRRPGIEVLGYVAELEELYPRCLGVIAPILGGSGVR